jgi:predicted amidophosphoribosyltransferase
MVYDKPLEDWEYPEPDDATITCPACRRQIYEDASRCPYCGADVDAMLPSIFKGRPVWFILLAVFGLLSFILVYALP